MKPKIRLRLTSSASARETLSKVASPLQGKTSCRAPLDVPGLPRGYVCANPSQPSQMHIVPTSCTTINQSRSIGIQGDCYTRLHVPQIPASTKYQERVNEMAASLCISVCNLRRPRCLCRGCFWNLVSGQVSGGGDEKLASRHVSMGTACEKGIRRARRSQLSLL